MSNWLSLLHKRHEWEQFISLRKANGSMSKFDDDFDCPHCNETITYDDYMNSEGGGYCPFCSEEI